MTTIVHSISKVVFPKTNDYILLFYKAVPLQGKLLPSIPPPDKIQRVRKVDPWLNAALKRWCRCVGDGHKGPMQI